MKVHTVLTFLIFWHCISEDTPKWELLECKKCQTSSTAMMDSATRQSFRLFILLAGHLILIIWLFQASFVIKQDTTTDLFTVSYNIPNTSDFKRY